MIHEIVAHKLVCEYVSDLTSPDRVIYVDSASIPFCISLHFSANQTASK